MAPQCDAEDEALVRLQSYGLPEDMCRDALLKCDNDAEEALDLVIQRLEPKEDAAPDDPAAQAAGDGPPLFQKLLEAVNSLDLKQLQGLLADADEDPLADALRWTTAGDAASLMHHLLAQKPGGLEWTPAKTDIARALVDAGFDVNIVNSSREAPIVVAVRGCIEGPGDLDAEEGTGLEDEARLSLVRELLRGRADPNIGDVEGETALMEASCFGDVPLCRILLKARAAPEQRCKEGSSSLEFAQDFPQVLRLLRACVAEPTPAAAPQGPGAEVSGSQGPGAEVSGEATGEADTNSEHPPEEAEHPPEEVLPEAQSVPPVNLQETVHRLCADVLATPAADREGVEFGLMLDKCLKEIEKVGTGAGMDPRQLGKLFQVSTGDMTMLLTLVQAPTPSAITARALSWLLAADANPNAADEAGEAALTLSVRTGSRSEAGVSITKALLQAAADPNSCDDQGETALMEAACLGDVNRCKALIAAKADVTQRNHSGLSPSDFGEDQPAILELLATFLQDQQPVGQEQDEAEAPVAPPAQQGTGSSSSNGGPEIKASNVNEGDDDGMDEEELHLTSPILEEGTAFRSPSDPSSQEVLVQPPGTSSDGGSASSSSSSGSKASSVPPGTSTSSDAGAWVVLPKSAPESDGAWALEGPEVMDGQLPAPVSAGLGEEQDVPDSPLVTQEAEGSCASAARQNGPPGAHGPTPAQADQADEPSACSEHLREQLEEGVDDGTTSPTDDMTPGPDDARGHPNGVNRGSESSPDAGPHDSMSTLFSEFSASVRRYDTTSITGYLAKMEAIGINVRKLCDSCDPDGNGLLHECVKIFHSEQDFAAPGAATVQLLIDLKCDPSKKNGLGETPLLTAARSAAAVAPESPEPSDLVFAGAAAIMRVLIEANVDPNDGDGLGETALMEAACIPSIKLCHVLLDAKADVLQKSQNNLTPLDFADDPEVAQLFAAAVGQAAQREDTDENVNNLKAGGEAVKAEMNVDDQEAPESDPLPPQSRQSAPGADRSGNASPRTAASQTRSAASPRHSSTAEEVRAAERVRKRPAAWEPPDPEERTSTRMTELLEKARRCPDASAANPPEKRLLGMLGRRTVLPLVDAVQAHKAASVKEQITAIQKANRKTGLSVSEIMGHRDADGHTVLHLAILAPLLQGTLKDTAAVVEMLIEVQAEVNAANLLSETPLLLAVRESPKEGASRLHLVERLLQHKADANLADSGRVTPLHEAANSQDRRLLELLLQHGGDAFLRGGRKKCSAFEELCRNAPSLAAYLSESSASIQGRPVDTGQARSRQGDAEAFQQEAERAAEAEKKAQAVKEQAIRDMGHEVQGHSVAGIREVVGVWEEEAWPLETLMEWQDHDGNGWLHLGLLAPPLDADWAQVREVVTELLALSAEADLPNRAGETPLWLLAREGSGSGSDGACVDLVHDLLSLGAQVDRATLSGRTALMEAAQAGDLFMCQALLKAGANADLAPPGSTSAARIASGNPELMAFFSAYSRESLWREGPGNGPATLPADAAGQSPMTRLRQQVMLHDAERLKVLLATEGAAVDLNKQDKDGNSSLHLCLLAPPSNEDLEDQLQTLRLLLAQTADPCSTTLLGETPLHLAVRETPPPCPWSGSPGEEVPAHPRRELVLALIQASADPGASDTAGLTPLMEACRQDDSCLVELFTKAGGDLNATAQNGKKAIDFAPAQGSVMRQFAAAAAEKEAAATGASRKSVFRGPALMQAVQAHDAKRLSEVIAAYKADGKRLSPILSLQDEDGHGFLHLCIITPPVHADRTAMLETIKVLLHEKTDPNAPNSLGETPLLLSVRELAGSDVDSRLSIVRRLMQARADADIGDLQDTTPLMEAAMLGDADLCRLLLDRGADMSRCGAGGLTARELAAKYQHLKQVFDEQGGTPPVEEDSDEEAEPVQVMLRHQKTGIERWVTVAGNATICDVKKFVVRLTHRGSWRRVALLTEQGRLMHDSEYLNGRSLLIMADAKSAEARQAAEEALPEEERWKRWSRDELKAEADRRGIFGGSTKDQILAALMEVKRWESLSVQDLCADCSRRGLLIDASLDKEDVLVHLKHDYSWDYMEAEDLKAECKIRGITLPVEPDEAALVRALRSRLRQVLRWEMEPEANLKTACELRNFEAAGKSKDEMIAWLKSFQVVARPKPKPKPKPTPEPPRRSPSQGARASSQGARASSSTGSRSREQSQRPEEDEEENFGQQLPAWLSDRVKRHAAKFPGFSGTWPPDIDDWDDKEVEAYIYSNGQLMPERRRKKPKVSAVPKRLHYKTLRLPEGASRDEVRKQYRRLALQYHPDKNLEDPEKARENFQAILEAYEALNEPAN